MEVANDQPGETNLTATKQARRVLVVDDEATMRDVLEMRLQGWGYEVLLASDAAEAESLVKEKNPRRPMASDDACAEDP